MLGKSRKKPSANGDQIKPDEGTESTANQTLKLTSFDIWALGITVVIGGQYFSWNTGLVAGFGSFLICTFLIGTAYICLCCCNGEVTSSLPFAGGAYGMARVSLGLYFGFIIGCLEISEYIVYVAEASIVLGRMISIIADVSEDYVPIWSLLFLIISCWIQISGGLIFWRSSAFLAVLSIVILLVYNFGSLHYNLDLANVTSPLVTGEIENAYFIGGFTTFLSVLPLGAWWYVGVETLNLATVFVKEPKVTIIRGSIACVLTLFLTSMFTLWVSTSLPREDDTGHMAGPLSGQLSPLDNGFKLIERTTSEMALILSIPATFATGFGFIYGYGRVILSMSRSDLFPSMLSRTCGKFKTPYMAILGGSFISYIVVIVVHFLPDIEIYLFNVTVLAAFTAYNSQFIGFILLRFRFPDQDRVFRNPLGIMGALYGTTVFTLATISVIGFQNDGSTAFIVYVMIIVICSIYYFAYAKKRQGFSEEEKFIFVLQIVKYNERAREESRTGKKDVKKKNLMSTIKYFSPSPENEINSEAPNRRNSRLSNRLIRTSLLRTSLVIPKITSRSSLIYPASASVSRDIESGLNSAIPSFRIKPESKEKDKSDLKEEKDYEEPDILGITIAG